MKKWMKEHRTIIWYFLGLSIVSFSLLPYFLLGEDIWVSFHDQLDGEVLNYIYQAKYLFRNTPIWELMNGISKTGMIPPAPFGVLFYRVFSPFWAYVAMQILVTVVAYSGLFLLLEKITGNAGIGFLCGCLYAYLPFMPVYGLSIAGQPILWYAFLNLYKKKNVWISYILIVLYAGFSSFVLSGFAVCIVIFFMLSVMVIKKVIKSHIPCIVGFFVLCGTYVLCNLSLFVDFMPGVKNGEEVSHRIEFVVTPLTDFGANFKAIFFGEGTYTPAYAGWIFVLTVVIILLGVCFKKKNHIIVPLVLLGAQAIVTVLALLWNSSFCINTIRQLGTLEYFQADRISWLMPPVWYILLGYDFYLILQIFEKSFSQRKKLMQVVGYGCILMLCGVMTWVIYNHSFIFHQLRQVVFPDTYKIMTWKQYYAEDIFAQIDESIGRDKSEYRVISLGMNPAAALYNGFYCLDGYSNNYSLDYKHEFREVMEKELDKSETSRIYYDEWGNRCYLVSAESGSTPMISKNTATCYQDLEIDVNQLAEMGCEYLFSAMEIRNAEKMNLYSEGIYETPSSYYRVYVYKVSKDG